jgi:autoinducer 2-degrading protein
MFVIIVDFLIKENEVENFKPLMLENARASLMDEPGCRQFDVCFDLEDCRKC